MNKVVLIGRLTQQPDARYTAGGKAVTSFSVACNYRAGDGSERTDYIDCVAWDKLAETVGNHLSKGRLVGVEGRLSVRKYTASDGQQRRVYEVVVSDVHFLDAASTGRRTNDSADFSELGSFIQ